MHNPAASPYAPIRLRDQMWWQFSQHCADSGLITPEGNIASGLPEYITNTCIRPHLLHIQSQADPAIDGNVLGAFMATVMELRHWVPMAGQYELCGRQIFDFREELVQMLGHTDFGDTTLEDWHPPYNAFFIRFGRQDHLKLPCRTPMNTWMAPLLEFRQAATLLTYHD